MCVFYVHLMFVDCTISVDLGNCQLQLIFAQTRKCNCKLHRSLRVQRSDMLMRWDGITDSIVANNSLIGRGRARVCDPFNVDQSKSNSNLITKPYINCNIHCYYGYNIYPVAFHAVAQCFTCCAVCRLKQTIHTDNHHEK